MYHVSHVHYNQPELHTNKHLFYLYLYKSYESASVESISINMLPVRVVSL